MNLITRYLEFLLLSLNKITYTSINPLIDLIIIIDI